MIFAAKEAVERRAFEKGRRIGIQEGRLEGWLQAREQAKQKGRLQERQRILRILEQYKVELPPEAFEMIANGTAPRS